MGDIVKEFVKNKYGINIVKCCASCRKHESDGDEKKRICKVTRDKHPLDYLCSGCWEMDPRLDNAGKGGGRVKKKSYIEYILKEGIHHSADYERKYGSRYLTKK